MTAFAPGDLVWYEPSPGHRFEAVVDSEPWLIGPYTEVVRRRDVGPGYGRGAQSDTTVPCAPVSWISPRQPDPSIDELRAQLDRAIALIDQCVCDPVPDARMRAFLREIAPDSRGARL